MARHLEIIENSHAFIMRFVSMTFSLLMINAGVYEVLP